MLLAGGAGRRLGGRDKAMLELDGHTLLDRVLAALGRVGDVVVVGPDRPVARPVTFVREDPPGSGPAAAVAAGLGAVRAAPDGSLVLLLAVDLVRIDADTVRRLRAAATNTDRDGAVLVDGAGREQLLISAWRRERLSAAVATRSGWADAALRELLAPLTRVPIPAVGDEAADVDTESDWARWSG